MLRLGWLGTPVVVACVSFMLLDGFWFYPMVVVAVAVSALALIGLFRLFRRDDAVFLNDLQVPMPFGLGGGLPIGRRS